MAKLTIPIIVDWDSIKDRMAEGNIVEVVRCEECVHSDKDEHNYCNKHMFWTGGSDFFCRDGEGKAL